jgi:hypothetical protein
MIQYVPQEANKNNIVSQTITPEPASASCASYINVYV